MILHVDYKKEKQRTASSWIQRTELWLPEVGKVGAKWVRGVKKYNFQWPSSKSLQTTNAGEGVEEREPSCTGLGV